MDPVKFFAEMRRRNVFRVTGTYFVGAWFLVQTAFTLEAVMKLPDWFDSLFMSLMILGAPVAVILAWAFELTPEGFKRTETVAQEDSIAEKTGRKLEIAIIIGLVLIGGLMLADRFMPSSAVKTARFAKDHSVAVLPFSNRSSKESDSFFADGIHDDLLTQLSKVSSLEVISRTSVMGYRETDKKIPDIAEELGVAVILEGAVQRAGDRVRITVQLIDGKDDTHLWAENYDRALTTDNIFDIQAEITQVIATSLETIISGQDKTAIGGKLTDNIQAYEAYIQGRILTRSDGNKEDDYKAAIASFDEAIAIDPTFGAAYAKKTYAQMAIYWFNGRDTNYRDAALGSLTKAKELAPDHFETLISQAFYAYWGFRDFRTADGHFDKALRLSPNNIDALAGKAFIDRRLGRFKSSAKDLAKAHRLDPKSFYLVPELGLTYALIGDFEKSNEMIAKSKIMRPDSLQGAAFEAAILQFQGDAIGAFNALEPTGTLVQQQKVNYAIATRNPEIILPALDAWPEDKRSSNTSPETYNLAKIKALIAMGKSADIELNALKARYENNQETADWSGATSYSPVVIPGLLGDLATVRALAKDYENNAPDDAMTALTQFGDLAEAFARCHQLEQAIDYLDIMRELMGPHIYLLIRMDPGMDNLREHPRYLAYKNEYDIWAAEKNGE